MYQRSPIVELYSCTSHNRDLVTEAIHHHHCLSGHPITSPTLAPSTASPASFTSSTSPIQLLNLTISTQYPPHPPALPSHTLTSPPPGHEKEASGGGGLGLLHLHHVPEALHHEPEEEEQVPGPPDGPGQPPLLPRRGAQGEGEGEGERVIGEGIGGEGRG